MSFDSIHSMCQSINHLARSIINQPAFEEVNIRHPYSANPETGFIRATSWLYCLYFEAGQVSLKFLRDIGQSYHLINKNLSSKHIEEVRCLRTELHHNLGFVDSDNDARSTANSWRRKACGTVAPTDEDWDKCYNQLILEANTFLGDINKVLRYIESNNDDMQTHINEWVRRLNRSFTAAEFDPLIEDAKIQLGRESLKTVTFRNRHVERWRKQLDLLEDGFNFNFEATRLIEKTLLDDDSNVLPITGRDIIDYFSIEPGPKVSTWLAEAKKIFYAHPCNKNELLEKLKKKFDGQEP